MYKPALIDLAEYNQLELDPFYKKLPKEQTVCLPNFHVKAMQSHAFGTSAVFQTYPMNEPPAFKAARSKSAGSVYEQYLLRHALGNVVLEQITADIIFLPDHMFFLRTKQETATLPTEKK